MKSLMSLLFALVVLAALAAGGWLLYRKAQTMTSANAVGVTSGGRPKLTAHNETHYVLTLSMSGPQTMRLQIAPGKSQTKTLLAGTYDVQGSLSDASTTPFKASWELKEGGTYDVPFRRSEGSGGQTGGLIAASP